MAGNSCAFNKDIHILYIDFNHFNLTRDSVNRVGTINKKISTLLIIMTNYCCSIESNYINVTWLIKICINTKAIMVLNKS
jgi:hypothetical protein